jgi:hypothetical protein
MTGGVEREACTPVLHPVNTQLCFILTQNLAIAIASCLMYIRGLSIANFVPFDHSLRN